MPTEQPKKALAVIPVLNEEQKIKSVIQAIPQKVLDVEVKTLVVNDGSTDRSEQIARYNGALVINHSKRLGYGRSVRDGFNYAKKHHYDYVVKLDGDGQHEVQYLSTVVKILRRGGVDYVVSSRYKRQIDQLTKPPLERRLVNIMVTGAINKITKQKLTDVFCGFFGLTTALLRKMRLRTDGYGLELEMLLKAHFSGANILEIPHPLIYTKQHSKFTQVFGTEHNLGRRLELYGHIILDTLEELNIKEIPL